MDEKEMDRRAPWERDFAACERVIAKACRSVPCELREDARQQFWEAILASWKNRKKGPPERPFAWLKVAARNSITKFLLEVGVSRRFKTFISNAHGNSTSNCQENWLPLFAHHVKQVCNEREGASDPFVRAARRDEASLVRKRLDSLPSRVQEAVLSNFEFTGARPVGELASRFRVTPTRVLQLARKGVSLLRSADFRKGQI